MYLGVIALAGLLYWAAVAVRYWPPWGTISLLRIHAGQIVVVNGRWSEQLLERVQEILVDEGISRGFIAILARSRIRCSRQFSPGAQQRVRNILVNRWKD